MLQSYPESPVSPSTSQGVTGSAADPVLVSNSAAQAQSNATSPPPPATRKSRVALACKRCKRRKQRVRHVARCLLREHGLKMM
ncbi:hypothetical protein IG631_16082 [Alternaria alternata]|nr:hypothetical protein IG631_16082 [Alternaria alternata]